MMAYIYCLGGEFMNEKYIMFNGVNSLDMNLNVVRIDTNPTPTPFFGGQEIVEDYLKNSITPIHFGTKKKPIEFNVQLSPLKEWTPEFRYEIGRWLHFEDYKPFQLSDDLSKIYYVIWTEPDLELILNKDGYINIPFRTNSTFAWCLEDIKLFDLSTNTTSEIIIIDNKSNINKLYRPKIEIELVDNSTGVTLKNISNENKIMKFQGLNPNETISIDCETELIVSNIPNSNPFAKFNIGAKRYWMDLVYGINQIEVTGKCKIWVRTQFPILQ